MQIRTKLALQFSLVVALLLILAMTLIYTLSKESMKKDFYEGLESKGLMTAEMVVKHQTLSAKDYSSSLKDKSKIILPANEKVSIYNSSLQKVFAFQSNDEVPLSILQKISKLPESEKFIFNDHDFQSVGIKYTNKLNEEYLLISQGIFSSEELVRLSYILMLVFFIIILLVGLSGFLFSYQALSPITHIIQQMNAVFPSQIGKRLKTGANKDEITNLALMFNNLLDKAEEAFLNQKGFLSNISHELKNPLSSAITQLEVTLNMKRSQEEYSEVMGSVLHDLKELKNVVEQLMALARITSGDVKATFDAVRLDELVWQVQDNLIKIHPEYKIRVDTKLLPEMPEQMVVYGNELLLKTAISNLCENACKFSADQTALVRIFLDEDNNPVLEVEDNGKTIPPEEQILIFKAFYRSPHTSHIKGTGIGLPLVQHIITLHKARIGINAGNTNGNKFTIWFDQFTSEPFAKLKKVS
ncbi:MAG: HAMP domain-containing histidine kinase [Saprospiraceae bacterium]|nr:HAMP domain-containing histidine kinase [Saprospiraceae bacterium]